MSDFSIRRARPEDAGILSDVARDTFCAAFAHLYPPEDLEAFLESSYAPGAFAAALRDPATALWIAQAEDGRTAGYAQAGPCGLPHPEVTPACGELKRLYLRPEFQNSGIGRELFGAALDWLAAPGRSLWIGVWSQNHGAQRFYARHGFEKVGEYLLHVGKTRDQEFILRRG